MQLDFCDERGYIGQMGYDVGPLRKPIEPTRKALAAARKAGLHVLHTRQGYRADLADYPVKLRTRGEHRGAMPGDPGPLGRILLRGEPGWQIIPELAPADGEPVIDKTANGAFYGTDLDVVLRAQGIENIAFCGNTIDVCVHTTLRDANDRGYQCVLLADCCGAVTKKLHDAAVEMIKVEGGVFGSVATSDEFVAALTPT
jgi:nicotinamidase-related amidase